ncbi:MAG TPA: type II toxin-antitoxin system HicA family toxin [bacterium]|nr:type II toxin-antitoxin system HicA family toxin [bacterium]HOC90183.1 type II toxin-antitoxin system HicA family toxin [bacterium]
MVKATRLTAREAETMLMNAGFVLLRSKGSHRIYIKNERRIVIPFHGSKVLHPKIIKDIIKAINESAV